MMADKAKAKYGTTADGSQRLAIPSSQAQLSQSNQWECSICTSIGQTRVSLVCGHVMCNSCALRSIETHAKCPFCQRHASTEDIRRIF